MRRDRRGQSPGRAAATAIAACLFAACGACVSSAPSPSTEAPAPQAPTPNPVTDWEILAETLVAKGDKLHACLVLVGGKTVFEANPWPRVAEDRHRLNSVTKSVLSLLVGIAVGEGRIPSIDARLASWFPEASADWPADKRAINLRHVLTMTEGLVWREDGSYSGSTDSYTAMFASPDPTRYVLDRPLATAPGTRFRYNSGDSQILSAILQRATGMTARDYAAERLFRPLGITDFFWQADRTGVTMGPSGLQLSPRDLAKIGLLCLARGAWEGRQLVPATWIDESTTKAVETPNGLAGNYGYGLHWWMNPSGGYSARGYGGQYLLVDPRLDIVAVFYGASFDADFFLPERLLAQVIVPAASAAASAAAPAPVAAKLRAAETATAAPPPAAEPAPLPALAAAISGRSIRLSDGSVWSFAFPAPGEARATMATGGAPGSFPLGMDGLWRRGELGEAFGPVPPNPVFARGAWEGADRLRVELRLSWDCYTYVFRFRFGEDGRVEERCEVPELGREIEKLAGTLE